MPPDAPERAKQLEPEKKSRHSVFMLRATLLSLALGSLGALAAATAGMPAPFLTGPATAVSLAGILGLRCAVPTVIRNACFVAIGLGLGSSVSPEILANAVKWPASLLGMAVCVVLIMWLGSLLLRHLFRCDPRTAVLGSTPGHLSFVLGLSLDTGANTAFISVVQSLRVLFLTLATPAAIAFGTDADLTAIPRVVDQLSLVHLGLLALLSVLAGYGLGLLRAPAAFLLGGMLVSVIGHGTGLTPGRVPPLLTNTAMVCMGTLIGTRFSGVGLGQIKEASLAAILLTGGSIAIVALASLAVVATVDLPFADVILALAPGGLETMIAMSAFVGADPAFVGFHHVARMFLLSALIPMAMARTKQ
ncbi:AbrB family transcriptional regulator [Rhodobacteraceae bacterium SC52]|nr:AbrB family transcriptional regulator [Rhodobacteraceae bacterium SC52]